MPNNLDELLQHAEDVIDNINNHKQAMVVRAVFKMRDKARACVAVGGGVLKGGKYEIVSVLLQYIAYLNK